MNRSSTDVINMAVSLSAVYFLLSLVLIKMATADIENDGKRCYSCTSYMSQCKAVVNDDQNDIFKTSCTGKCFVRMGEDGAMYRGCFDGFVEVGQLTNSYSGCRNQTWNGKSLPWCLCDEDLCNGDTMDMHRFYNIEAFTDPDLAYDDDKYNDVTAYHGDVYVYNELENSANRQRSYNYDDAASANHDGAYNYDSTEPSNQDAAYMDKYAREAADDDAYDEALFGGNDIMTRSAYVNYRTPLPREYKQTYYNQNKEGLVSTQAGTEALYYPQPQYYRQQYYPYEPEYNRQSGPQYNYNSYNYGQQRRATNRITSKLASKIRCSKSGYYQNPNDCRQFIACLMDPYSQTPIMHLMKCPEGLLWDNDKKICMQHSSTCNADVTPYDVSYDVDDKLDVTGYKSNTVADRPANSGAAYRHSDESYSDEDSTQNENEAYNDVAHVVF